MRMDPPTAYVYPDAYDKVTLIKGPQTVLYGPCSSAGVVLFDRDIKRFEKPDWRFNGSLMAGSFGRHDEMIDLMAGVPLFYVRATGTNSHSDNYKDGDGKEVHSKYDRWSVSGAVGWTPDKDTRLELTAARSDGEAAYADRSVDGSKFERENYGLKFEKKNISTFLQKIETQVYYNYIDHVMDNYSLRTFIPSGMGHEPSAMNPDRETVGGRASLTLQPSDKIKLDTGGDFQINRHTGRSSMSMNMGMMGYTPGQWSDPYQDKPREEDARFRQVGLFGEMTYFISEPNRVISGVRIDWWSAQDKRKMLDMMTSNPNEGDKRSKTLPSGFIRYEHDLNPGSTLYAGLGHSERFPDFWELMYKEGPASSDRNAFTTTKPEKTTQLDVGASWKAGKWVGFVAGFYNNIDDYILIQSNVSRGMGMMTRTVTIVRNIDAVTWGGEAGLSYAFTPHLKLDTSLAYVHGENDTDDRPLAQIPPLEAKFGLTWDNKIWSVGSLWRVVASQSRYAVNQGNIVGQDIGRSSGLDVFSLNGSWRPKKGVLIAAGIDNLFDRTYAEHISRSGAMIAGFEQTSRVNEPGRTFWLKASVAVD